MPQDSSSRVPVIDISSLTSGSASLGARRVVAQELRDACSSSGFFYVTGHGVSEALQSHLEALSQRFFAQTEADKLRIAMARGGRAWRGYFRVGDELTSGQPDIKEGIYFGEDLEATHPMVRARTPLHGPNLFPDDIPEFRETVLEYLAALTRLGHQLMSGIALSLGLDETYFADHHTTDPLILFRIFNYPPPPPSKKTPHFGVGEHTDYGLLTILKQDLSGGLEVKINGEWVAAPPIPNTFVCNVGDMLDRMTNGRYLSVPHRVRNVSGKNRLSFAFFFDPNFNAEVQPIESADPLRDNQAERWDQASVHTFQGTYGDYLLRKVASVFPELHQDVL